MLTLCTVLSWYEESVSMKPVNHRTQVVCVLFTLVLWKLISQPEQQFPHCFLLFSSFWMSKRWRNKHSKGKRRGGLRCLGNKPSSLLVILHNYWFWNLITTVFSAPLQPNLKHTYVAVPGKKLTIFRCIFWSYYCIQSALVQNFHWGRGSYALGKLMNPPLTEVLH